MGSGAKKPSAGIYSEHGDCAFACEPSHWALQFDPTDDLSRNSVTKGLYGSFVIVKL
jgi:hypothetical protein